MYFHALCLFRISYFILPVLRQTVQFFFQKTGISHDPVFKPFLTEPSGVCKENRQIRLANSLSDV